MVDDILFLRGEIAYSMTHVAYLLDNMADMQRVIDVLPAGDDEEILMAREIIHDEENLIREIMEDVRDKNATIKRLEKLSGAGSGNQQPRIDSGTRSQGPTPIQGEMQPSRA